MNLYQPTISGSLEVSGSATINGTLRVLSGSVLGTASIAENSLLLGGLNSGSFQSTSSFSSFSGSLSTRLVTDEANIATNTAASASFAAQSASLSTRLTTDESNFTSLSSSFATTSGSVAGRVTLIEGQYATTGSNNFTKPQQISDVSNAISFTSTASLYTDGGLRVKGSSFMSGTAYFNDVVVYGTSSIEYITSSQLAIGTNIITLNTDTPSVRFGGISVFDSGSNNLSTGSLFWDSEKDKWIYSNPSASTYDGGMLISGPRNSSGLGNEVGTTSCALMMGQGGDHITSSAIFSYGNATCFYGTTVISGSGNVCIAGTLCAPKADFTSDATCVAVRLINGTITGGSTTGVTGLYLGDAGSGVAMLRREKYAANQANVTLYSEYGYSTENITACLGYNGVGFFTAGTQRQFIDGNGVTCFSGVVCSATGLVSGDITLNSSKALKFASNTNSYVAEEYGIRLNLGGNTTTYGTHFYNQSGTKVAMIDATGGACFSGLQICNSADPSFYFYRSTCNVGSGIGRLYWNALDSTSTQRTYAYVQSVIEACSSTALCSRLEFILASNNNIARIFQINGAGTACFTGAVCSPAIDVMPSGIGVSTLGGLMRVVTTGTSTGIAVGQSNANRYTHFAANDIQVFNDDYFITTRCFYPLSIGTCYSARLTFAASGEACFKCQVCVPSLYSSFLFACTTTSLNSSLTNTTLNLEQRFGDMTGGGDYQGGSVLLSNNNSGGATWAGGAITATVGTPSYTSGYPGGLAFWIKTANNATGTSGLTQAMRVDYCGRVGISTTTPSAKFHSIGTLKYQNSTYNGFAQSFVWQSSFDNPPQLLYQFTSGNNYAQTLVKVTFIQNGVSAGYAGWFEGYALAHRNPTALTTVAYAMTAQHNPNGITAPTLSWSNCALCITPNRATNYDGYVVYLEWGGNTNNNATPEIPV